MRVIICGAGTVGSAIAEYLVGEKHDVVMIDKSAEIISNIGDILDVQAFVGNAAEPSVLDLAGAVNADMIIASTESDEVNMLSCQVASTLFNVPLKLARIRNSDYLSPRWEKLFGRDSVPVDALVSTENAVARTIARRVYASHAFDIIPLAQDRVRVVGIRITANCPIIKTPLRQVTALFPDVRCVVISIARNEQIFTPESYDYLLEGDRIYFSVATDHLERAMTIFGYQGDKKAQNILIIGAGKLGILLVEELKSAEDEINITIVEKDRDRAYKSAEALPHASVLAGDVMDSNLLEELDIDKFDISIAVTKDDELNTLATLMLKKKGVKRGIAVIDKFGYSGLVSNLGVDVVISPRVITVSSIIQHIRQGRIHSAYSLFEGRAELFEISALSTSSVVGKKIRDLGLPKGVIIGGVIRDDTLMMPYPDTVIYEDERVIVFAQQESVRAAEKLFSVTMDYF